MLSFQGSKIELRALSTRYNISLCVVFQPRHTGRATLVTIIRTILLACVNYFHYYDIFIIIGAYYSYSMSLYDMVTPLYMMIYTATLILQEQWSCMLVHNIRHNTNTIIVLVNMISIVLKLIIHYLLHSLRVQVVGFPITGMQHVIYTTHPPMVYLSAP